MRSLDDVLTELQLRVASAEDATDARLVLLIHRAVDFLTGEAFRPLRDQVDVVFDTLHPGEDQKVLAIHWRYTHQEGVPEGSLLITEHFAAPVRQFRYVDAEWIWRLYLTYPHLHLTPRTPPEIKRAVKYILSRCQGFFQTTDSAPPPDPRAFTTAQHTTLQRIFHPRTYSDVQPFQVKSVQWSDPYITNPPVVLDCFNDPTLPECQLQRQPKPF